MRYEVVIKQEEERRRDQPGASLSPDGAVARKTQTLRAADAGGTIRFPLSSAQRRIWFLDQLAPSNSLYRVPTSLRMRGRLDVSALPRISMGKARTESG